MWNRVQRWWQELSTRDRRLTLVAVVLVGILAGYHGGLKRVFAAYRAQDDEIGALEFQLDKIREALADASGVRARFRLNEQRLSELDSLLLPEERENLVLFAKLIR